MSKQRFSLRGIVIAAVAGAALSLPMISAAQAQSGAHQTRHRHIYNTTRDSAAINRGAPAVAPSATPAFEDYRTWPEGSPDYHGSNG